MMKKLLPFVFPLLALLIVLFLAVRWYRAKTLHDDGSIPDFAESTKVEDVTPAQLSQVKKGAKDLKSVLLLSDADTSTAQHGDIRYDIIDNKVVMTVYAMLPQLKSGEYAVWLKSANANATDENAKKRAFSLTEDKAGYIGTAAISADALPFDVLITQQQSKNDSIGQVLLHATIPMQTATNSGELKQ